MKMRLDRIPTKFCEGPFWGNGRIGSVLYVRDGALCICLDHTGLWEMRETLPDEPRATFSEILKNKQAYLSSDPRFCADTNIFENAIGRTKLPSLAIMIPLPGEIESFVSRTDLKKAVSEITISRKGGGSLKGTLWIDSLTDVLLMKWQADGCEWDERVIPLGWDLENPRLAPLKDWDYPACKMEKRGHDFTLIQPFSGDKEAVLSGSHQQIDNGFLLALTIETGVNTLEKSLVEAGAERTSEYLAHLEKHRAKHQADWEKYWSGFGIEIPNARLQEAFEQEMYKLYCNEREFGSPITLQGIWNPDNRMPAWFGDLHNDLNVEACYWAAFRTGNVRLVRPYVDAYAAAMPRLMERAKKLFGVENAIHLPVMMAPDGTGAASEWCFWNTVVGPELFAAADFTWFYEYTQEMDTLRKEIYPFIRGVVKLYQAIAEEREDGYLHIPFTMSPEMDLDGHMLLADDATFALITLRDLCEKLDQYEEILGEKPGNWGQWSKKLVPVETTKNGYPVYRGIELTHSHRHFSHLFAMFPLNLDGHSDTAENSLNHLIDQGMLEYASWSFPYLAILASRCSRGNMCRTMLELYCMCFRSENSFTVNGDPYQNGVLAVSDTNGGEPSDSFTLEAGLIVPAALCELFAHRIQDAIWIGAGIPDEWENCNCHGIQVEGGHHIDVEYVDDKLRKIVIKAEKSETVTINWKDKKTNKHQKFCCLREDGQKLVEGLNTGSVCLTVAKGTTYEIQFDD